MNLLEFVEVQRRETLLHRIPPEAKLIIIILAVLTGYLGTRFMLMFLVFLTLLFGIARMLRYMIYFSSLFWVIGGVIILINYLLGYSISATVLRLFYAMLIALASIIFMATTDIESFERFLRRLRLPESFIKTLVVSYNLIPSFYMETLKVRNAQYARGFEWSKNPIRRAIQASYVILPMFFLAIIRGEMLRKSILARGG